MLSISKIQESYGFKHSKWKVNGELLDTEKGIKRLILWSDEKNARWHLQWRDSLWIKSGSLTNRMLQTVKGQKMLLSESGWITLHDEVSSLFPYKGREKEFGKFIGLYFSQDLKEFETEIYDPILDEESLDYAKKQISTTIRKKEIRFLEAMRKESLFRLSKATRVKGKNNHLKEPVVAPIRTLDQGKIVFEKFYWHNITGKPERGYHSLKTVLSEWLQRYGQNSLFLLLNEIDKYFPLKQEHGQQLLANCLAPWEYIDFIDKIKDLDNLTEVQVWKEKLSYQWEASRALVQALDEWLDATRKKVNV
ncbi:hypothetical protein ACERII_01515 [Evansella sp. AB-rgal1]|uniref:hypothetical protein n=1 Tax=Evansella sp. AB-rgal1 TaxID=3242696 RepID=UPI00359E020A